ncbi:MAG: ssl1498 family light-harvesting-like protein [Cyanobacteria bacterium P01_D01_bin.123]
MSTYRTDERGVLNNFPIEVEDQVVEPPTKEQQLKYVFGGLAAMVLLGLVLWTAFAVSA